MISVDAAKTRLELEGGARIGAIMRRADETAADAVMSVIAAQKQVWTRDEWTTGSIAPYATLNGCSHLMTSSPFASARRRTARRREGRPLPR